MRRLLLILAALTLTAVAQSLNPNEKALLAGLWMQQSAEYRALCLQTYMGAARNLDDALALNGGSPLVKVGPKSERPMAVIMDLDETVIDNSGYQSYLYLTGSSFNPETWSAWLAFQAREPRAQRSVPGAIDFIRHAESRGVKVFYISNRPASGQEATAELLEDLGVQRPGSDRLLLGDKQADARFAETWGDAELLTKSQGAKERRRIQVQMEYQVVEYFGDDLADFVPYVKGTDPIAERYALVQKNLDRWGTEWYVLPNPTYGSWVESLPKAPLIDDFGFGKSL